MQACSFCRTYVTEMRSCRLVKARDMQVSKLPCPSSACMTGVGDPSFTKLSQKSPCLYAIDASLLDGIGVDNNE